MVFVDQPLALPGSANTTEDDPREGQGLKIWNSFYYYLKSSLCFLMEENSVKVDFIFDCFIQSAGLLCLKNLRGIIWSFNLMLQVEITKESRHPNYQPSLYEVRTTE